MQTCLLLAQASDPISGGAGWVGAGLLGLVLAWLLFVHLPAKDKQLKEFAESKDKLLQDQSDRCDRRIEAVMTGYFAEMKDTKTEFKAALGSVLVHCEKDMGELIAAFRTEIAKFGEKR